MPNNKVTLKGKRQLKRGSKRSSKRGSKSGSKKSLNLAGFEKVLDTFAPATKGDMQQDAMQMQPGMQMDGMMHPGMMQPGMMQQGMPMDGMMQPGMMQGMQQSVQLEGISNPNNIPVDPYHIQYLVPQQNGMNGMNSMNGMNVNNFGINSEQIMSGPQNNFISNTFSPK